jgi:hypothetical protein
MVSVNLITKVHSHFRNMHNYSTRCINAVEPLRRDKTYIMFPNETAVWEEKCTVELIHCI